MTCTRDLHKVISKIFRRNLAGWKAVDYIFKGLKERKLSSENTITSKKYPSKMRKKSECSKTKTKKAEKVHYH